MSGDVQPRKRKDKKRRKDEGEQIPIQTHPSVSTPSPTIPGDDVNIHVHKEDGTGGGICAKLVFFVLLSALVVVIGMIITQYRGFTDVETVDTESRFSQIFEGWIDSSHDHHDDHNLEDALDEHDLDHDEEDDDEHNTSENDEEEEEHEVSNEDEEEEEEDDEDNEDEISEEINDVDDEDEDQDEDEEEQVVEESEERQLDEDDEEDEPASEEDEEEQASEESREKDEDEEANELNEDEQDLDDDEQEMENIESDEGKDDDEGEQVSTENKSGEDDDDQEDDETEDVEDTKEAPVIKVKPKDAEDNTIPVEDTQQQSSGLAVKLGVGVALLVVAHLVLVRKWRTAPDDKIKPPKEDSDEPIPDLSRRNTIVVPPTFQEVEPDIEPEEEDYSEEEELSEEEHHEVKSAKTRYQELRSTYTRSLTPEGEIDYHKPPETYDDEYDDNEVSEEEEEDDGDQQDDESEGEEEEYEYDEDEDEELLKRLEAKYGKLRGEGAAERQADIENSDSEKSEDSAGYEFSNITNKEDHKIKSDIDEAQKTVQNNSAYAIKLFDKILQKHPSSPRSIYGKALALDNLADQKRSNEILDQALKVYLQLLNTQNVPDALFDEAAERCINRMRFVGKYRSAITVHQLLIQRFPDDPKYSNDLAVTLLTINRVEEARSLLKQILSRWPNDGFALVHYGFIIKTTDNKLEEAVNYLQKGIETKAEGVIDGRFFFHLGDALARLGQTAEAMKVYEEGVQHKVFLSKYQRSLYNVPRLTGKPWWNLYDLPYLDLFRLLKQEWKKIRDEGLAILNEKGYFQDESENLKDTGDWKQFELFARGQKSSNCKKCPITCSIIERIPEAKNCKRGQTKFSVMHPGTHVWPHCGPTNCRLRAHLGLKVPPKTFIRVADEIRSWEEGEIFVFDDSFEHEVWHNGTEFRLVLIVDIWHPELTAAEKRGLSPI